MLHSQCVNCSNNKKERSTEIVCHFSKRNTKHMSFPIRQGISALVADLNFSSVWKKSDFRATAYSYNKNSFLFGITKSVTEKCNHFMINFLNHLTQF